MIKDELHEKFLSELDDNITYLKLQDILKNNVDNVEICLDRYSELTYGKTLPIVWVSNANNHGIEEFYSAEYNLPWLVGYTRYYSDYLSEEVKDTDLYDIYRRCLFMGLTMTMVGGINIVNDTIYVLSKDVNFINYNIEKKLFI